MFIFFGITFDVTSFRKIIGESFQAKNIFIAVRFHCPKDKFSHKDFFSKRDQIRSFLRIWSHLLKKSLTEILYFMQCLVCMIFKWTPVVKGLKAKELTIIRLILV